MTYDIPFVPSSDDSTSKIVELAAVEAGEKAVDLGAGDGKLVVALAQRGAEVDGIEIDAGRSEVSRSKINLAGLRDRARIIRKSFWEHNLSPYDVIVLYGVPSVMARLERKIASECKKSVRIVSNYFTFPDWQPAKSDGHIHLYLPFGQIGVNQE